MMFWLGILMLIELAMLMIVKVLLVSVSIWETILSHGQVRNKIPYFFHH